MKDEYELSRSKGENFPGRVKRMCKGLMVGGVYQVKNGEKAGVAEFEREGAMDNSEGFATRCGGLVTGRNWLELLCGEQMGRVE